MSDKPWRHVLSGRQYSMLQTFVENSSHYMSIKEAQSFDQRPFRSMLVQRWIEYRPGKGFHVTRLGRDAWHDYHNLSIERADPTLPLTSYFDPDIYGLRGVATPPKKKGEAA